MESGAGKQNRGAMFWKIGHACGGQDNRHHLPPPMIRLHDKGDKLKRKPCRHAKCDLSHRGLAIRDNRFALINRKEATHPVMKGVGGRKMRMRHFRQ